jgi:hypothetical protein
VWFLAHAGLLGAALAYDPWPHEYRRRIFHGRRDYVEALARLPLAEMPWLRVIRDPCRRAVSSFRHALRHGYEDDKLSGALGRRIDGAGGFSFAEFVDYLETIDVSRCNLHHRQQENEVEALGISTVVLNVDRTDLDAGLRTFERARGLQWTADKASGYAATMTRIADAHWAARHASVTSVATRRFTRAEAGGRWPRDEAFLDEERRARVRAIYRRDCEAYAAWL